MRKRLTLGLTPLVVSLALLLPASTLAVGPYEYTVKKNYCGVPSAVFKVRVTADGTTNANKLTIDSKLQAKTTTAHDNWMIQMIWGRVSTSFAPSTYGALSLQRSYLGEASDDERFVFTVRAWHNSTLLWSAKVISKIC